jgi:hypothetical protein
MNSTQDCENLAQKPQESEVSRLIDLRTQLDTEIHECISNTIQLMKRLKEHESEYQLICEGKKTGEKTDMAYITKHWEKGIQLIKTTEEQSEYTRKIKRIQREIDELTEEEGPEKKVLKEGIEPPTNT